MLLSVMMPSHEVFELRDFDLLVFVGSPLHLKPFGLLLSISGEVPTINVRRPVIKFQCDVGHLIEEVTIVTYNDQCLTILDEIFF